MLPHERPGESARVKAQLEILVGPAYVQAPSEAVRLAYEPVRKCTENDVKAMAGFLAWGKTLRHLRDGLRPAGWVADRSGNFETVRNSEGTIAIASARGDENTGTDRMPCPPPQLTRGRALRRLFRSTGPSSPSIRRSSARPQTSPCSIKMW
jgi:hypothetical protein